MNESSSPSMSQGIQGKYVGFWMRSFAACGDFILLFIVLHILHFAFHGVLFGVFNETISVAYLYFFWLKFGATPGNMLFKQRIMTQEVKSLNHVTTFKRILVATISYLLLGLPYLFVPFDDKKQGLHDKLARTYVVKEQSS